ncbi:pseudouridine synthase [Flavobacteriaceae bacterium R38]|nr:pseudouridine synthase [Flavobacteriaceae bacterium R38]
MGSTGRNNNRKASGKQGGGPRKKSYAKGNTSFKKKGPSKPSGNKDEIRLNKYIANSGVCSRRDADIYIASGNVTVNGKIVNELGYKVKLTDEVRFDGRSINPEKKEYILLNKPKGFLTTTNDEKGRRTVMELVSKASKSRLLPVGRLDRTTTGLLLFTNDGEMVKKLTHSKNKVRKIYHVELDKNLAAADLNKIKEGLNLDDGLVKVDEVSYIENAPKREIGIKIYSSKNQIIKRIFEHLGYEVIKLDRVVFAGLTKKDLPRGHWRPLNQQEVINLGML